MVPVEYLLGAGYGISLWLITSGLLKYIKGPEWFAFVLEKDTLNPLPEEELPEDVREYKNRLEESFKRSVLERTRKIAIVELLIGVVLLIVTAAITLALAT
ncbi:hypothetical protein [Thermococcus waiotapuensis]|uniref:DUF3899 domain-containing protein n=1 Tax=Thermococcus waiotapuensis TaxID=90909 RepID=A0AAE4T0F7_9EURY|nr:hypothetical protein [Thermococcus waiotapuensis]MDV3103085.1 hypothetical protein [Thermococcus waiotapuensis]